MARVFRRGKKWYIDYSYRGRRIMKAISKDKRMAELALKNVELKIEKGEYLGIEDQPKILFRQCAEKYLAYSEANKAPKSFGRDVTSLEVHLIPSFGGKYLHELRPEMIENYKATRLTEARPATVNRELACLRNMLNKAVQWGYLTISPMKGIRLLKEPPERVRFLAIDEVNILLERSSDHLMPIILCALHTGMRKGEILNLKWSNIDLHNRMIVLEKTKNNRRRMIPLHGRLYSVLKELPRKGDYVFCSNKGEKFVDIKNGFKGACRRAGIKDFRFHDLRHTFASHLVMSGCNIRTVQQLLGHTTIKTTMKYSHLSKEHLEEAINLVGAKLSTKVETDLKQLEYQPRKPLLRL